MGASQFLWRLFGASWMTYFDVRAARESCDPQLRARRSRRHEHRGAAHRADAERLREILLNHAGLYGMRRVESGRGLRPAGSIDAPATG